MKLPVLHILNVRGYALNVGDQQGQLLDSGRQSSDSQGLEPVAMLNLHELESRGAMVQFRFRAARALGIVVGVFDQNFVHCG